MFLKRTLFLGLTALTLSSAVFANTRPDNTADANASSSAVNATQAAVVSKTDLNKASMQDLMKVKGIDKKKAKNILTYKSKHGNFKSVDDLQNVAGFKKMKKDCLQKIQAQLTVE